MQFDRSKLSWICGVLACALAMTAVGCSSTTVGFTSVNPGYELALRVKSWRSPAMLTNHGPQTILLTVDAEGDACDMQVRLEAGPARPIPLYGWTQITISNPAVDGAGPASFTLIIPDPCEFDGGMRAIEAPK